VKDRAGTELSIGDRVLFLVAGTSNSRLEWGTVAGFTPKMVEIEHQSYSGLDTVRRNPNSVVLPMTPTTASTTS
jgi:hypothetical protein